VYNPLAEIVPALALPPATPFTSHVTVVSVAPITIAWNCCINPRNNVALVGSMATTTLVGFVWIALVVPHPGSQIARRQKITNGSVVGWPLAREQSGFAVFEPGVREFSNGSKGVMCAKT